MSIRFVPSRHGYVSACMVVRNGGKAMTLNAADDNAPLADNDGAQLGMAFGHFGRYGRDAARTAGDYALAAHASGDMAGFSRWLSVCRVLDRRLARSLCEKVACDI